MLREMTLPLDSAELAAWRAVVENAEFLLAAIAGDLAPTGLSLGEYQVLVFLSEAPDRRMRMIDLATKLRLSPSGLTRRIDGLVNGGLVERIACDDDRRVMWAQLTPAGHARLVESYPIHLASVRRRFVAPLDREQLTAVASAFEALRRALHDDDSARSGTAAPC